MASATVAACRTAPAASSCTTSALPPSTRHTARRRPTVVSGSYVTLSSSTRRTVPPAGADRLYEPHAPSVSPGSQIRHHIQRTRCVSPYSASMSEESGKFTYPAARRLELTEDVLGYQVSDAYRWLEDSSSAERDGWLRAQAELFA